MAAAAGRAAGRLAPRALDRSQGGRDRNLRRASEEINLQAELAKARRNVPRKGLHLDQHRAHPQQGALGARRAREANVDKLAGFARGGEGLLKDAFHREV